MGVYFSYQFLQKSSCCLLFLIISASFFIAFCDLSSHFILTETRFAGFTFKILFNDPVYDKQKHSKVQALRIYVKTFLRYTYWSQQFGMYKYNTNRLMEKSIGPSEVRVLLFLWLFFFFSFRVTYFSPRRGCPGFWNVAWSF